MYIALLLITKIYIVMTTFNTINNPHEGVYFNGFPLDELQFSLLNCGVSVSFRTKLGWTLLITSDLKRGVDSDKEIQVDDIRCFSLRLDTNKIDSYGVNVPSCFLGDWLTEDCLELINLVYSLDLDCLPNKNYSNV